MDLILIREMDMGFSLMFSDPHCRYTGAIDGYHFNQTDGHEFEVLRSSLQAHIAYRWIWI